MFKGPKAILSSAIANALAEYFEVDANQIQSNLLGDANIVLHAVELKEQITYVPQNSAGNETIIRVTGCVEEATSMTKLPAGAARGGSKPRDSRNLSENLVCLLLGVECRPTEE